MTFNLTADPIGERKSGPLTARHRERWIMLCTVLFAIAGLVTFARNAGRMLVVDTPQPSDLIVVLAGETDLRPAEAIALLKRGYAPRVLIDVPANSKIFGFTELQLAKEYAHNLPETGAIDICPIEGLSTRAESHDVAKCLKHETAKKVLIVTSDFHTRRSLSIFRHELEGRTFSTAAVYDTTQFGERWWTHRQWAKTCFDEWLRLLWWNAIERWI